MSVWDTIYFGCKLFLFRYGIVSTIAKKEKREWMKNNKYYNKKDFEIVFTVFNCKL